MEFTGEDIITFLIRSGFLIGVLVIIVRVGKLVQKIEHMGERIEHLDKKIDNVNKNLSEKIDATNERLSALEKGQTEMRVQLGRVETRVEERTLRVIHTTKEIKPDPFHLGDITLQQEKVVKNAPTAV